MHSAKINISKIKYSINLLSTLLHVCIEESKTCIVRTASGAFSCNHIGRNGVGGTRLSEKNPELFNYEIEHNTAW